MSLDSSEIFLRSSLIEGNQPIAVFEFLGNAFGQDDVAPRSQILQFQIKVYVTEDFSKDSASSRCCEVTTFAGFSVSEWSAFTDILKGATDGLSKEARLVSYENNFEIGITEIDTTNKKCCVYGRVFAPIFYDVDQLCQLQHLASNKISSFNFCVEYGLVVGSESLCDFLKQILAFNDMYL